MAVQGNVNISLEEILTKVSEEELFKYYTNGLPSDTISLSPLRKELKPSFIYGCIDNKWKFKDFGNDESGNIIDFIRSKYKCTYSESLNIIVNDFNILNRKVQYFPEILGKEATLSSRKKKTIKIRTSNWNSFYLDYWYEYGISKQTLEYFNVFPITHYWVYGEKGYRQVKCYKAYAYLIEEYFKILDISPNVFQKWATDCPKDVWQGYDKIPNGGETIIITKSLKDIMVLYECGITSVAPQNEISIFPENIIKLLKRKFTNVILLYDNDETGYKTSKKASEKYKIPRIFVPNNIKDISTYSKEFGIIKTKEIMLKIIKSKLSEHGC